MIVLFTGYNLLYSLYRTCLSWEKKISGYFSIGYVVYILISC